MIQLKHEDLTKDKKLKYYENHGNWDKEYKTITIYNMENTIVTYTYKESGKDCIRSEWINEFLTKQNRIRGMIA